jgi:orotate phosphoribosyltransferase
MMMTAPGTTKAQSNATSLADRKQRLLEIIRTKSVLRGEFKLASGAMSNYYLDLKPTTFDPEGAALIGELVFARLKDDVEVSSIGGLELGAVPIVVAVSQRSWPERPLPGFVVRKEAKGHGTDKRIDANFVPNTGVALIEDVTTKGGSVLQAVRAVRAQGARVSRVVTIVDRLEGAEAALRSEGIELDPLFTVHDVLA